MNTTRITNNIQRSNMYAVIEFDVIIDKVFESKVLIFLSLFWNLSSSIIELY